jgi:acetyl esterase
MKKFILVLAGSILLLLAFLATLVYRWTITPYGRLHPVMAIIHRLMTGASTHGFFDRDNLAQVRSAMNLVRPRVPVAQVSDRLIAGSGSEIPIRIYTPDGEGPFPVIVYFHGGGFSIGSITSHENITRSIARAASCVVISVEYRLAPEHPFPAGFDDAYTAVEWVAENAGQFNGDGSRLAVAGDSAGGNLAAAVSIKARDEEGPAISLQILLYAPATLAETDFESRQNFAGYILTEESGAKILGYYLQDKGHVTNPYVSPLLAESHSGLPPAYIMTAGFDPLLDDGKKYAERLDDAGVPVTYHNFESMLHGFLSFDDLTSYFPLSSRLLREPEYVYADVEREVRRWLIDAPPAGGRIPDKI